MKSEKQVKDRVAEAEEDLKLYQEELRKHPTNEDFKADIDYLKHFIKHLEWVLK